MAALAAKELHFTAHRNTGITAYSVQEEATVVDGNGRLSATVGPNQMLTLRSTQA